ncbi:hypothetical protein HPE56_03370 [Maribacter sp. ANRC-HE7]|uniref:D-isomer specific 2-hydroxyacid dehydrogenase catalytic domain-containing protein n=1 Tax=Maribacter aquimaris TaxID=2737171 RepID=A0ABR7UYW8_9FLAO|nr:NAD(P)-dependent oxidoreductase [Maribacter aquimaris]MBD0776824.1 hypothetical protein [Maribacter aquimaris]
MSCHLYFYEDDASEPVIDRLYDLGIRFIVLRSAAFNNIDVDHAQKSGISIARVPEYSTHAIVEFTIAVMLAQNRKLFRTNYRVKDMNFPLNGLAIFDMNGKTVGIIVTGRFGWVVYKILYGFWLQTSGL